MRDRSPAGVLGGAADADHMGSARGKGDRLAVSFPAAATPSAPLFNANLMAAQMPLTSVQPSTPRENSKLTLITCALWEAA